MDDRPRVHLGPSGARPWLAEAIEAGGGRLVELEDAEALVWADPGRADELAATLAAAPGVRWVQLPWAGIEPLVGLIDDDRTWTCGKGVYAEPVAEHALMLALAGMRGLAGYARARTWTGPQGRNLLGADVCILGGGGIATSLLRLLEPFDAQVTVVRRTPSARHEAGLDRVDDALAAADLVVLALALTPQTIGLIDARRLGLMRPHAWLVNVARGAHVVTDDLVAALRGGIIGGAALDVVDPEPLPEDHPLWTLPNVIVTPHVGNTPEMAVPLLAARVSENVRRFAAGEPLIGLVDPAAGY